ncbi:hypothetical protein FRC16_008273 [Serendipita sp. 398]|nr:hypothetical protein FRC16_008273 [Serendipita sp. 398]
MATSNPQPRPNRTFYIDVPVIKGISSTFRPKNTQNADQNASKVKVASLQPLQTSKSVNQLINRKRGRDDDEKNAKDAPQKRRQLQQVEKKPIQKLKADAAVPPKASNVITKDAPVKKPIVKKAPQPLWTRVGVDFTRKVRGRGMSFYDILCHLQQLRHKTGLNIPNLVNDLKVEPHTINADALIPVMLGLIDDLLQTRAVRSELDKFKTEMADVRKGYYAAVKEEKERWAGIRVPMMEEKKKGGPSYDAEKWKKKFEAAKAKHDANEHAIKFDYVKNQAAIAPRYTPLVDKEGRTYYIHTPSTRKPPAKSSRDEFMKWTWFVAVWGKLPEDAKRIDIPSDVKKEEEGWWGFGEAAECELLAKWIQFKAEEAEETERAASSKNSSDDDSSELTEEEEDGDEDGDVRVADSKRLVAALLDFADVLRYADDTLGK